MAKNNKKTYWPHMIVGFLLLALTLSFWTVKTASSLPVQEVNNYMMKYQQADIHMNDILEKKQAFDKDYTIVLENVEMVAMTDNIHAKRPQPNVVKLAKGMNQFMYQVKHKNGTVVNDANVSFLLTRPHSRHDDVMQKSISFDNAQYHTQALNIKKEGRYTLQLRVVIGNKVGYLETPAYLKF
jgi:hypothetical protein